MKALECAGCAEPNMLLLRGAVLWALKMTIRLSDRAHLEKNRALTVVASNGVRADQKEWACASRWYRSASSNGDPVLA